VKVNEERDENLCKSFDNKLNTFLKSLLLNQKFACRNEKKIPLLS
jgi:hypothetical protein